LQNHISLHQRTIPIYIKKLKSKMSNSSQKLKIFVFSLTSHIKVYKYEEHERWIRFASRLRGQVYTITDWNLIEKYQ
jgi:hypothetical protein